MAGAAPDEEEIMYHRKRKLGRGVALVGAGMSKFGAFKDKVSRDLFVEAFNAMKASVDKGMETNDIEALYIGNATSDLFEGQCHVAPIMTDWIGGLQSRSKSPGFFTSDMRPLRTFQQANRLPDGIGSNSP